MLLANLINESNGNVSDFKLSQSTANRKRKSEVQKAASEIRNLFKEKISNLKQKGAEKSLVLHFDGKAITEFTAGRKGTNKRVAPPLSSVLLRLLESPKLDQALEKK